MPHSRQLAAIMFTDIVGYTELMDIDEQEAFALLKANRALQKPIIEQFRGRWLKELGDGVLASFDTISDAVYAAVAIQQACEEEPGLKLRIGIHQGEVVFEHDDVFGSGVNIASRLQSLAPIGGVLVSESVHKNAMNKKGISSDFVGEKVLHGVSEPMKVYEIKADTPETSQKTLSNSIQKDPKTFRINKPVVLYALMLVVVSAMIFWFFNGKKEPVAPSIAVLPFTDMSPNRDHGYIGEAIADQIINELVKIEGLKVIGRTSSFSFQGKQVDLITIGEELNVNTILEGSVQLVGDKIRFIAQLINAKDGSHLWSEKYDAEFDIEDIFQIQSQLAQKISQSLLNSISAFNPTEGKVNDEAYRLFLQAKSLELSNYTTESEYRESLLQKAKLYKQAIELDSKFLEAYVELAGTYHEMGFLFGESGMDNVWRLAESNALDALKLDHNNSTALKTLSYVKRNQYWDWEGSKELLKRAIVEAPSDFRGYQEYAMLLSALNQHDSAIYFARKAVELNPISNWPQVALVRTAYYARKYRLALDESKKLTELMGAEHAVYDMLLNRTENQADHDQAIARILESLQIDRNSRAEYEKLYHDQGWKSLVQTLYEFGYELPVGKYFILIHGAPTDKIFERLNIDADNKVGLLAYLLVSPVYDPIRNDPRYDALLKRMGLDRYRKR